MIILIPIKIFKNINMYISNKHKFGCIAQVRDFLFVINNNNIKFNLN